MRPAPSPRASPSSWRGASTPPTWPTRSSTSRPSASTSPAAWSRASRPTGAQAARPRGSRRARPAGRPAKDPLAVALFVKRAGAARLDRPTVPFGPQPVDPGLLEADAQGRWGVDRAFGGRFVPETLMAALLDLEAAYDAIRREPAFWAEFRELLARYVGRPTPCLPRRPPGRGARASRRSRARPPAPLPEARGPRPHGRPQDQQRPRPGAPHAAPRQAARHRRDRRRPARRGDGHGLRPAGARLRRLHGC